MIRVSFLAIFVLTSLKEEITVQSARIKEVFLTESYTVLNVSIVRIGETNKSLHNGQMSPKFIQTITNDLQCFIRLRCQKKIGK